MEWKIKRSLTSSDNSLWFKIWITIAMNVSKCSSCTCGCRFEDGSLEWWTRSLRLLVHHSKLPSSNLQPQVRDEHLQTIHCLIVIHTGLISPYFLSFEAAQAVLEYPVVLRLSDRAKGKVWGNPVFGLVSRGLIELKKIKSKSCVSVRRSLRKLKFTQATFAP